MLDQSICNHSIHVVIILPLQLIDNQLQFLWWRLLFQAIERWEKVTELVLKREDLLAKLEKFERAASDPNRFFEKGT